MSVLPDRNVFDGSKAPTTTVAEMKSALGTTRDYLADLLGTDSTNKAAARAALSVPSVADWQSGSALFSVAAGTVDAMTIAMTPAATAYRDGMILHVRCLGSNTSATPTLKVDSLAAMTIVGADGGALRPGAYQSNWPAMFRYRSATGKMELLNPITSNPSGGIYNRLINGSMMIDQRNAGAFQTFVAGAAIAYCVDRWYASCTGVSIMGRRVSATAGGYAFIGAAGNTGTLFGQRIESYNVADLVNANVVEQIKISSSSITTVTWTAYYATTQDTFSAKTQIATGTFTINSTPTVYNAIFNAGANAANGIAIEYTTGALLAGQSLNYAAAQFEPGVTATAVERRPYGFELGLCQRYLPSFVGIGGGYNLPGQCINPTTARIFLPFKVTPRIAPTGAYIASVSTSALWNANAGGVASVSMGFSSANLVAGSIDVSIGSNNLVAGNATMADLSTAGIYFTGCEL